MKALSLAILMTLGFTAQASMPSDLSQYFNHKYKVLSKPGLTEGIPNKGVKTKYGTVYTKLFNLCQEDGMIKTISPVRSCAAWGYKVKRCDSGPFEGQRRCFDRDERECKEWTKVEGSAPIHYTRQVCARLTDREARQWRRRNNDDRFRDEYPNCSVFKSINMTLKTNYDFIIISNFGSGSNYEERRYGGPVVDELDYTIPACSSL